MSLYLSSKSLEQKVFIENKIVKAILEIFDELIETKLKEKIVDISTDTYINKISNALKHLSHNYTFCFVLMQKGVVSNDFTSHSVLLIISNRQMIFSGEIMFYGRVQMIRLIDDFHAILNENLLKGWTF